MTQTQHHPALPLGLNRYTRLRQIPPSAVDLDQTAGLLTTLGQTLDKATDQERKLYFGSVLDEVYVKQKKIVAVRPKPAYYDLLRMSAADPTGFEPAISALTGPHVRPLHHGSNNSREREYTISPRRRQ